MHDKIDSMMSESEGVRNEQQQKKTTNKHNIDMYTHRCANGFTDLFIRCVIRFSRDDRDTIIFSEETKN